MFGSTPSSWLHPAVSRFFSLISLDGKSAVAPDPDGFTLTNFVGLSIGLSPWTFPFLSKTILAS